MSTTAYNTLTIQLSTPPQLPWDEQVAFGGVTSAACDLINLPYVSLQAMKDALASIANSAQPGFLDAVVDGQLSAVAPIGTITYTGATGALTVTIGGVAVSPAPIVAATDAVTAANVATAINTSTGHQLVAFAYVLPASPTVVNVQGRWPGPGLNTIAFAATSAGGTATVSAATLGGSASGNARAGATWSQLNRWSIGNGGFTTPGIPAFP